MSRTAQDKRNTRDRAGSLRALLTTAMVFLLALTPLVSGTPEAHAATPENPYASSTITKIYDGTGQGTPDGTFINADNGYVPGDNTPTDGVVATNDYVGYEVETRFQAGPERTVVVSFNAPEYLKFTSATNPGICASNSFVTGTPVTSGNTITGCSYKVKRGVGVTVQHNLTATALDTKGEAIYDQVTSIGTGISGQGSYSSHNAEAVTVVSAPTADLVLRPSTCTVAGSCSSIGSSTSTGYLEVMVDALKWPGYNTDKGASTLGAWTAQLDVSDFPDGTVWSVDGITAPVSNGVLNLGPHSGSKQISFSVPEHWGLEEGQTKGFNAHLIVPDTAFETESYKNNGTGWEPGQGNPSGYSTYDDKSTGARRGYVYANNDWTRINVTRAKPVAGQIFFKGQERPWSSSQTLWEDGNKLFSAGTPTSVTGGSRYPTDAKYKYWDMVPGTEMLTKVGTYTNNIDFQQGDTSRTNVIISDEWDTNFVEADATRETYVTGPDGKRVTSRVRIQWSTTVKGASIAAQPPSDTGWVTSDKPMDGATSVRAVFDELPTGNSEGAGQYTLHVPTRIKTTLAEPEIPTTTSDTMRGSYAGATSGTISVPVSIVTMSTPELGIAVEPSGTVIPADTNAIDYTITPTVDGLLSSTDLINGAVTITLDPCINEYTLNSEQWEIVTEDMGLGCGDEGFNTIVLKLRDDWNPSLSFNGGKTTVPKISITAKWSKITDNPGFVSARWELDKIDGAQSEKLDDVVPVSGSATVTPIPVSVAGQMITTSTPKVEIGDTLKYQAIVEAAATGAGSVSANSTVVVMPGRGDDNAFRALFDDGYFDGPESSEFHGTYTVSKVQIVTKDSVPGTTVQCTTDTNPSLDPSQGTWGECVGSRLTDATAIKVNQAGGDNQGISTVDIELVPIGNETGDNYLMWIGAVTGADITAGYSMPANDEVVSSDISGYTYWDITGKGFDYRDGWPIQADITVQLLNSTGKVVATTQTDENGYYEFTELHSGEYQTRVPDIGATGGFPKTMPSAFYPDRVIDVSQTFSYRGQKLANASTTSSRIKLGIDATQANVNFGFTAPDPYSDLKKDAATVQCTGDEVVCNVSWDITVKNGGTPFEPGEILGATGTSPAASSGSGVWTTDGYYVVKSDGTATKANTTGTVLGATGTGPAASSGSGVWTTDGYYIVSSNGTATKANTTGTVLGATGTSPAASSGSGVWTTDGYYIVASNGSATKAQTTGTVLGATGSSYGSGVWTTDGYYIVSSNGTATKANTTGTVLGATGTSPAASSGSGVWTTDGYYVVKSDGTATKAQTTGTVLGATGTGPAGSSYGSGVWTTDGYYIVASNGSATKAQTTGTVLGATGGAPASGYGSGVWTTDGYYIVASNGSATKANTTGTVLGATGTSPAGSSYGSGVWTTDGYYVVKSDGTATKANTTGTVLGATGTSPAGSSYGSGVWTTDGYYIVQPNGTATKANIPLPEAPEFTGTPVTLTGGKLTDSTSKEVYDLEAIIGKRVVSVSAGDGHSLALASDGTVYAWGNGRWGQLGIGSTPETQPTPIQVKGVGGDGILDAIVQVSAGSNHSLALASDGTVYAWGRGINGQLGNGSQTQQSTPVQVKGVGGDGTLDKVVQISAGSNHSLALTSDSRVYAWGSGQFGQLGNGSMPDAQFTPVKVVGADGDQDLENVIQVSAGGYHSLAVTSDNRVYAWGWGSSGQLGNGLASQEGQSTPLQVKGVDGTGTLDRVMQVSAGSTHSLALGTDGGVYAWGRNNYGELGNGSTVAQDTPVKVKGVGGVGTLENIDQVSSGGNHSLALTSDGTVYAWGNGSSGKLGNGTVPDFQSTPVQVKGVGDFGQLTGVVQVSTGSTHSLAMGSNGSVYAWGSGVNGKLGDGSTTQQSTPVLSDFSFFDKVILATLSQTPNGDFITRDYQLPNLEPGEEVTVTLSGKVNRKSYESPVVSEGFVIGNQAWETFTQTPRNTPDLPRPNLPAYSKDTPYAYGKWTGNSTCTATENWVTPGDQCDQVYAQVEPTNQRLGSLDGYLWVDSASAVPLVASSPRVVNTPVTLYRGVNGEFQSVAGTAITDSAGYYRFDNLVPGDDYYVHFAPAGNPDVSVASESEVGLLGSGQSWVWTPDSVGDGPTVDRAMTDDSGVTTPNVVVVMDQTTSNVNGAIRVHDVAIEAAKGTETEDGFVSVLNDRPWDATTEVVAIGKNTGSDDLKDLVFTDRNLSGDRVVWESCSITDGDPDGFDLSGGTWDDEMGTFTATLPESWVLRPGTDTLTCVGTLSSLGSEADDEGYHKDEIVFSGVGVATGVLVDDDSPFEVTTTPKVQPVPAIELEKGVLVKDASDASECEVGEVFAQDGCWIKDYTSQVGEPVGVSFRMTNTGEEPLLDMSLDDRTTIGGAVVEDLACEYEVKEVNGRLRSVLEVGKTATCTGILILTDVTVGEGPGHKDEAIVWAVGEESSQLVSDDSEFTARAAADPPVITLPNAGGHTGLIYLVVGVAGAALAAFAYTRTRKNLS